MYKNYLDEEYVRINEIKREIEELNITTTARKAITDIFNNDLSVAKISGLIANLECISKNYVKGNLDNSIFETLLSELLTIRALQDNTILKDPFNTLKASDRTIDFFINHMDLFYKLKRHLEAFVGDFECWFYGKCTISPLTLNGMSKLDILFPNYNKYRINILIEDYIGYARLRWIDSNNPKYHFTNKQMFDICISDYIKQYNKQIGELYTFQFFYLLFNKQQEQYFLDTLKEEDWLYITEDMFKYYKEEAKNKVFMSRIMR